MVKVWLSLGTKMTWLRLGKDGGHGQKKLMLTSRRQEINSGQTSATHTSAFLLQSHNSHKSHSPYRSQLGVTHTILGIWTNHDAAVFWWGRSPVKAESYKEKRLFVPTLGLPGDTRQQRNTFLIYLFFFDQIKWSFKVSVVNVCSKRQISCCNTIYDNMIDWYKGLTKINRLTRCLCHHRHCSQISIHRQTFIHSDDLEHLWAAGATRHHINWQEN